MHTVIILSLCTTFMSLGNGIVNNNAENFKEVNACIFQHTTPEENVHDTVQKRLRRRPRK